MFLDLIKKYDRIIIHRHNRPDMDALGSQLGLKEIIKDNFNNKEVYAVGDMTNKYEFIGKMDLIDDKLYENSLVIITDVQVKNMVSDERYKFAKELLVIDHHNNDCDITNNVIKDITMVAACELITKLAIDSNLKISSKAATYLYAGLITDSGRFLYGSNMAHSLSIASKLCSFGADFKYIYDNLYVEPLEYRKMKAYFENKFIVDGHVAYLFNDKDVFDKFNVEFMDISRGMVQVMSGIKEIEIWANFTYDVTKNKVIGEFRSRNITIVDIAKKYGGGGHNLACGATLDDFNQAKEVIKDFKKLIGDE